MQVKPMTINERMMYSTVRIEGQRASGEDAGGTSFFLSHPAADGSKIRMLVSSRHAVGGVARGTLHLHRPRVVTTAGQVIPTNSVPVEIDDFEPRWIPHPNPEVDLCALPYDVVHAAIQTTAQDVYGAFFESQQVIPPDESLASVDAAEEVQLLGYPEGVWDHVNSFPVYRRGTIATHPRIDFHGKPEVLIDVASPDGCSGAPVVILTRAVFKAEEAESWPVILLGVLISGFARGIANEVQGKRAFTPGTLHLGVVVKAREVLVLAEAVAAKVQPPG